MSEIRLSPVEGWSVFAARMVNALALGGAARGVILRQGLERRLPEVYDQAIEQAGTLVPAVATEADVLVAETLVNYAPALPTPRRIV